MTVYRIKRLLVALAFAFTLSGLTASAAFANEYYVAPTGSDSNPGTISDPWKTFTKALRSVSGGDTVYFRAGTYAGGVAPFDLHPPAGEWITFKPYDDEAVIIDSGNTAGDGAIELHGASYLIFDGFEITNKGYNYTLAASPCDIHIESCQVLASSMGTSGGWGIVIHPPYYGNARTSTHNLIIRNNHIHHNISTGIMGGSGINPSHGPGGYPDPTGTYNVAVLNNHIHHNGYPKLLTGYGLYVTGNRWLVSGNVVHDNSGNNLRIGNISAGNHCEDWIVENNVFHSSHSPFWHRAEATIYEFGWGAVLYGLVGGVFRNNIVYNNRGVGVWSVNVDPSKPTLVYNNTIYGNALSGLVLSRKSFGKNNIVYENARVQPSPEILVKGDSIAEYNLVGGSSILISTTESGIEKNNIQGVDPLFVNAAAGDFGIQPTSPAIDTGTTLAEVPDDFTGADRPEGVAYDIGAFEGAGSKAGVLPAISPASAIPPATAHPPSTYDPGASLCP